MERISSSRSICWFAAIQPPSIHSINSFFLSDFRCLLRQRAKPIQPIDHIIYIPHFRDASIAVFSTRNFWTDLLCRLYSTTHHSFIPISFPFYMPKSHMIYVLHYYIHKVIY
jgi:hypothetical protein